MTNEDRLAHHLTSEFAPRSLGSFDRDGLQALLSEGYDAFIQRGGSSLLGSEANIRYGGCRGIFAEKPGDAVVHAERG